MAENPSICYDSAGRQKTLWNGMRHHVKKNRRGHYDFPMPR